MSAWKIKNTTKNIKDLKGFAGVYTYTLKGKPLYIGKSTNVKARLLSHLENARVNKREALYVHHADTIELQQTDSELNALLLESKLIQTHKPKYNVRWMDDKSYLYIKITTKDTFPKIFAVRKETDKRSTYFGPFASQEVVDLLLGTIRKIFPFCTQKEIGKRPCFYAKLGLCNPCPNTITTAEEKTLYRKNIRSVIRALTGNSSFLEEMISKKIKKLAQAERYEEAMKLRNVLYSLKHFYTHKVFDLQDNHSFNRSGEMITSLTSLLIPFFPAIKSLHRIECYDISNTSQQQPTASMVVYIDGQITKSEYKKFKIGKQNAKGDFAMLREAVTRRLKNNWSKPDLIILDGGKPQLRAVLSATDIPMIGIAKHPDRLVIGTAGLPTVRPRLNNPGLHLVQQLRDEAHRFAKKYHTMLRSRL